MHLPKLRKCCPFFSSVAFGSLCCRPNKDYVNDWLAQQRLGFAHQEKSFSPCPVSLTPWKISGRLFANVRLTSKAIARLLVKVSEQNSFLNQSLADYQEQDTLLQEFKQYLLSKPKTRATPLTITRQDFLLDQDAQWKLVESNAIAAGMGPFSETLQQLQHIFNPAEKFAENPATYLQAKALVDSARQLNNRLHPTIIFLIDANEDNIHDQARLINQIEQLGATVEKLSLIEANTRLTSKDKQLVLDKQSVVDCIYFRTGYNLKDYLINNKNLLSLRYWFEQHDLVVAPSIAMQVASSKWLQMKLAQQTPSQLKTNFKLTREESELCFNALNLDYQVTQDLPQIKALLDSQHWILKTQSEGGGNVQNEIDISSLNLQNLQNAPYLLMQKIESRIRTEKMVYYTNGQLKQLAKTISEIGIFNLGENLEYGGYLLRSKPYHQLEAGVHHGGGLLDCVALTNN